MVVVPALYVVVNLPKAKDCVALIVTDWSTVAMAVLDEAKVTDMCRGLCEFSR